MWPVSQRFLDTVSRSHRVLAYVDFLVDGEVALTLDGSDPLLSLSSGTVKVAAGQVRRQADLTLVDRGGYLVPVVEQGLIVQGISEVRIWSGVVYWDATEADWAAGTATEYVPAFTGPIMNIDLEGYPLVKAECSDRMAYVQRLLSSPYTVTAGQTLNTLIERILRAKVPPAKLSMNIPTTTMVTKALVYDEQTNPADKVQEIATSAGWTVFADQNGTFQAVSETDITADQVVFSYEEGPGGALILPALTGSADTLENTWVVTGEAVGDAQMPYGKAVDDNPNSPTYVRGSFDEWPDFFSSPLLTSDAQCRAAARTRRAQRGGIGDQLRVQVFPNPALDRGDVISVTGGIVDRFMVADSFDLELAGAAQTITARAGRLPGDEET